MDLAIGLFFLGSVLSAWCVHMAARRRKDPSVPFYLGNVNESGRKYVWVALFGFLLIVISFFFS
jgi:hypothetical protein